MESAIRAEGLTKYYGSIPGVLELDLEVRPGEVFGYLGPNGAGKSTTIRLLLDLIRPTAGRAEILGMDARARAVEIRQRVGYLPGELSLYESLTGTELLDHFASLRGRGNTGIASSLAERLRLDLSRSIAALSRGNKQKVGLVQAFMHEPDLLILDEPTSGLDPLIQHEFQRMVQEVGAQGRTVFLSSHVLSEVEAVAHRVGIIRAGRLAVVQEVEALKSKSVRRFEIHFSGPVPADAFEQIPGVREALVTDGVARLTVEGPVDALVKAAARFEVVDLVSHEPDLEEIFLTYYAESSDEP